MPRLSPMSQPTAAGTRAPLNPPARLAQWLGIAAGVLIGAGAVGPLGALGHASLSLNLMDVSPTRAYLVLGVAAASIVAAALHHTRWHLYLSLAPLLIFGSMAVGGSGPTIPGLGDLAFKAVTFRWATYSLVLGIITLAGVGIWRRNAID